MTQSVSSSVLAQTNSTRERERTPRDGMGRDGSGVVLPFTQREKTTGSGAHVSQPAVGTFDWRLALLQELTKGSLPSPDLTTPGTEADSWAHRAELIAQANLRIDGWLAVEAAMAVPEARAA